MFASISLTMFLYKANNFRSRNSRLCFLLDGGNRENETVYFGKRVSEVVKNSTKKEINRLKGLIFNTEF